MSLQRAQGTVFLQTINYHGLRMYLSVNKPDMRDYLYIMIGFAFLTLACAKQDGDEQAHNPFINGYDTPFGVPPFDEIGIGHYLPAFEEGISRQRREIDAIADQAVPPTFENTLVALEQSGALLTRVSDVFFNLTSAHTNDSLQAISRIVTPRLSALSDYQYLNAALFERVKAVYEKRNNLGKEELALAEKYYKDFLRGGANLTDENKERLKKINEELSLLSLQFGENVLKETNRFELVIDDEHDLKGLPDNVVTAAAEAANDRGYGDKWLFTIQKPSLIPFLQYAERRDLREKMYKAYINMGNNDDALDNKEMLVKMANLRLEKANLLGYEHHAALILEKNMAGNANNVRDMLDQLWVPALEMARQEVAEMQAIMDAEGSGFKLQPWDWWYYAEKVKRKKYALDEEELRPYFELESVRKGMFEVASRLFGLQFEERNDIPVYHSEVKTYEVKESDGTLIGIYLTDYFPRASKRGGAWMNAYRKQSRIGGEQVYPIIVNVCNFTKPSGDTPALLSPDEAETMFHEFGHALHGLLSDCTYPTLSGTSVPRDFVEFPSQIMENWAMDPRVLKMYAHHYKTGDPIPDALIQKMVNAAHFNQGFVTVEYLAASILDQEWHTITEPFEGDAMAFEQEVLGKAGLLPEIVSRYRSPYFRHVFSGGYSSGYYSYIWSEVLDADAYAYFEETDIFDQDKAQALRKLVLSAGGTGDPMEMYVAFRGRAPEIEPLLRKRGLKRENTIEIL
jgi:peptidyl-dipeptidase Dcp